MKQPEKQITREDFDTEHFSYEDGELLFALVEALLKKEREKREVVIYPSEKK